MVSVGGRLWVHPEMSYHPRHPLAALLVPRYAAQRHAYKAATAYFDAPSNFGSVGLTKTYDHET
jgi:hypothetical protein